MNKPLIFLAFANDDQPGRELPALVEEENALCTLFDKYQNINRWGTYSSRRVVSIESLIQFFQVHDAIEIPIFHFAGHAEPTGISVVHNEGQVFLHIENLSLILQPLVSKGLKLVFLNGCATKDQVSYLHHIGVPAVIATRLSVFDYKAKMFSESFYRELVQGSSLERAFCIAESLIAPEQASTCIFRDRVTDRTIDTKNSWGLYINPDLKDNKISDFSLHPRSEHQVDFLQRLKSVDHLQSKILAIFPDEKNECYTIGKKWWGEWISSKKDEVFPITWKEFSALAKKDLIHQGIDGVIFFVGDSGFTSFWQKQVKDSGLINEFQGIPLYYILLHGDAQRIQNIFEDKNAKIEITKFPPLRRQTIWKYPDRNEVFNECLDDILKAIKDLHLAAQNILERELVRLNFIDQISLFRSMTDKEEDKFACGHANLILIEGSDNCAQELLIRRIMGRIKPKIPDNVLPIVISIDGNPNLKEGFSDLDFLNEVFRNLGKDGTLFRSLKPSLRYTLLNTEIHKEIIQKLSQEDIVFVFNDIIKSQESFNSIFQKFWEKLTHELETTNSLHRLFIFAIHKGIGQMQEVKENTWDEEYFSRSQSNVVVKMLKVITPLGKEDITNWHDEYAKPSFRTHQWLGDLLKEVNISKILEDPYMSKAIAVMGDMAKCPQISSEILNLHKRL